jgi:gamma-glutamylaminecyclotransferase
MKPIKLFVYGTLLSGLHNHHLLKGAKLIGEDRAPGVMHCSGGAPITVPSKDGEWVLGEVYEVTSEKMLERLDSLEGHPTAYTRTPVTLKSGAKAEIYYWSRKAFSPVVEDGDYRKFHKEEAKWKDAGRLSRMERNRP